MAFDRRYFAHISLVGTPAQCRISRYVTTDPIFTVLASGYFNILDDSEFNIGDIIIVSVVDNLSHLVRGASVTYIIEVKSV